MKTRYGVFNWREDAQYKENEAYLVTEKSFVANRMCEKLNNANQNSPHGVVVRPTPYFFEIQKEAV